MRILLIGNYAPDRQESMLRYGALLREGLQEAGHDVTFTAPLPVLNRRGRPGSGVWKWIGYMDKYLLHPRALARSIRRADVVHVCDHSNAVYVPARPARPHVVTCHDLLAVRGALGEDTDCPATFMGRRLQMSILDGLRRAHAVACVSGATLTDAQRLLGDYQGELLVAPNSLNYPYRRLEPTVVRERLARVPALQDVAGYVLNVGSNLRRKNRETVLRSVAVIAASWKGRIVFAGQPLNAELRRLAHRLGVLDRVVEVVKPDSELLEALYNGALGLLFPSRFEGFGWPIIEAQACGCPVICSNVAPFPEVAGGAAILRDPDDHAAFGQAILDLHGGQGRDALVQAGVENTARYERAAMIARFSSLYERLAGRA